MKLRTAFVVAALLAVTAASPFAQTFTVLHTFPFVSGASTNTDGAIPQAGLVASGASLYGTTVYGGTNGNGTVFSVGTNGNGFTVLHSFSPTNGLAGTNTDGANPLAGLVVAGGTLYGTAVYGGTNGNGTVFSMNTNGSGFTVLHTFTAAGGPSSTNADGWSVAAGLALSGNRLYGTAFSGGTNGSGTLFSVSTNGGGFTVLHTFAATGGSLFTNADGAGPQAGLLLSGNTLYGTTVYGGTNGNGTLFSVSTNGGNFTVLHTFSASGGPLSTNLDGWGPYAGLVSAGDTLYGTAYSGGTNGNGTVFSVSTNGSRFGVIHTFTATNGFPAVNADGVNPFAGLQLSGNTLYGTAQTGGTNGQGTVFSVSTNGSHFAVLHAFTATGSSAGTNTDGIQPWAGLVLSGGTLYGTTVLGGTNGNGTVFSLLVPPPPVSLSGVVRNLDGSVTIDFAGGAGFAYLVQAATNLAPPVAWQTVATNLAGADGTWQFRDAQSSGYPMRFYRSSTP